MVMKAVSRTEPYSATRPDVVAAEVHQHQVLGALLGIGGQLLGERGVLRRVGPPRDGCPAIGRTVTSPSSTRTRISGELPMMWMSSQWR